VAKAGVARCAAGGVGGGYYLAACLLAASASRRRRLAASAHGVNIWLGVIGAGGTRRQLNSADWYVLMSLHFAISHS